MNGWGKLVEIKGTNHGVAQDFFWLSNETIFKTCSIYIFILLHVK